MSRGRHALVRRRHTPWWWPFQTRLTERGYLVVLVTSTLPAYGVLAYIINTR